MNLMFLIAPLRWEGCVKSFSVQEIAAENGYILTKSSIMKEKNRSIEDVYASIGDVRICAFS
jgi:hypothetical protein